MNFPLRPFSHAVVAAVSIGLLSAPTQLHAFGGPPGGPFGNGSYFPTEGTFQATIRAINLSGVATFNSSGATQASNSSSPTSGNSTSTSSNPAGGTFAVSYQGSTYTGNVDGAINPRGGSIAAVLEGSSGTSSSGGNGPSSPTTVVNTLNSVFGKVGTRNVDGGQRVETFQETVNEIVPGGTSIVLVNEEKVILEQKVSPDFQNSSTTTTKTVTTSTTDSSGNVTTVVQTDSDTIATTIQPLISVSKNVTETVAREVQNPSSVVSLTINSSAVVDNPDTVADDFGWIDTIATSTFLDTPYASGFFNARLENSFPNQVFNGDGAISFSEVNETAVPPVLQMVDVPIKVRGVRISNSTQNYTAKTVQKPTVVTSTVVENRPKASTP